jgi:glycosyltransferase involved in cell wall biosynthesis
VIAVGRYTYQKGFDLLIQAWKLVNMRYPDWVLNIYGPGNREDYQQMVEDLQLSEVLHCNEASPDIYARYAEHSIFVLSSRYEGFGLVIAEAMATGLPAVSFRCPCGPEDIITDHEDGLLVENGNIEALAEAICYMIEHPEERLQMAGNALLSVQRYREDAIMQQWINLFEAI